MMRIAVLTSGRQDWGILRSTCRALAGDPRFELVLLVGGMHCAERFGRTESMIAEDGLVAAERLDWVSGAEDAPAQQAARALAAVAGALERRRPDALLLVGDRFETVAAALAATLARVPIVHLHGGEQTAGAFDDALRHSISKLAHLHLVSHPDHARRVIALGEAASAVHVVGAPGLDNLTRDDLPDRAALEAALGVALAPPVVVVTVHPATLGASAEDEATAVAAAMDLCPATYVITLPNSDPGHAIIRRVLCEAADRPGRVAVDALGEGRYFGLLRLADAMLGNSSSALIEGPALGLPAVNVGDRQAGRLRGGNVIDVAGTDAAAIAAALGHALDPATRARARAAGSPYGDGNAAARVLDALATWTPPRPPRKPPVTI